MIKRTSQQRALDVWAQDTGYASFEVYLQLGGSLIVARRSLLHRIVRCGDALEALEQYVGKAPAPAYPEPPADLPEALIRLAAEAEDEPVDPHNAQIQGDDHAV